jgi:hypothetical protein
LLIDTHALMGLIKEHSGNAAYGKRSGVNMQRDAEEASCNLPVAEDPARVDVVALVT